MKIEITQQCIDRGTPANSECCALSLAFMEAGFLSAEVGEDSIDLESIDPTEDDGRKMTAYEMDGELLDFIRIYDSEEGKKLAKPFTFDFASMMRSIEFVPEKGKELTT